MLYFSNFNKVSPSVKWCKSVGALSIFYGMHVILGKLLFESERESAK